MIIPFQQPRAFARIPGEEEIRRVVLRYFKVVDDPFYVVRSWTVAEVVARAAGINRCPALGAAVGPVLEAVGGQPVWHNGIRLVKRLMPTNLTEDEAWELSAQLRQRKRRRQIA